MNTLKLLFTLSLIITVLGIGKAQTFNDGTLEYTVITGTSTVSVKKAPGACTSTSITIPETVSYNSNTYTVVSILNLAFHGCNSLLSISIPSTVNQIEYAALAFISSLENIVVDNASMHYSSEMGVLFNKDKTILIKYPQNKPNASYVIPNTVVSIGPAAFYQSGLLTSIQIPSSVTTIGNSAFYSSGLTSLEIPSSITEIPHNFCSYCQSLVSVTIPNTVTSMGGACFNYCSSLTSISIPNSVTSIGSYAFSHCTNLTNVSLPNSITEIPDEMFSYCSSLPSIVIPNSVTSLYGFGFAGCTSLTSVTIPNSVPSIGGYSFRYCTSLQSITLPSSIESILWGAFENCTSLTDVTCLAYDPPFLGGTEVFLNLPTNAAVSVPYGSLSAYSSWSTISTKQEIEEISQEYTDQCYEATSRTIGASNNNQDLYFHDSDGKLICMINANGNNLGEVTVEVNRTNGTRMHNSIEMLGRNIKITPTTQPSTPVTVRLYYIPSEMISGAAASTIDFSKTDGSCASTYGGANAVTVNQTGSGSIFTSDTYIENQVSDFSIFYASPDAEQLTSTSPVEFATIDAVVHQEGINLLWSTYSEMNNAHYEVEHSIDGREWKLIGKVKGGGDQSTKSTYRYIHSEPSQSMNYYRIKQVDYDGHYTYSDIASAYFLSKGVTVYPNPTKGLIFLDIPSEQYVEVYNATGRLIKAVQVGKKNNSIDLSGFHRGIYILRMGDRVERIVKK